MKLYSLLCLSLLATLFTCQTPQSTARDSIAAFQGYLVTAQAKHTNDCIKAAGNLPVCNTLRKADAAENAAVDALEGYCQIPPHTAVANPNQPCSPVSSLASGLNSAVASMNSLLADIKAAAQ